MVVYATQRPLYSFKPDKPQAGRAGPRRRRRRRSRADGKTVTVKSSRASSSAPPVNRAVTSEDVKYAFERGFNPNVPNGYATRYYPIVGADKSKGGPISGITTPDKTTIVFKLTKNFGATFAQALSLPAARRCRGVRAKPYDKKNPSTYDSDPTKQAFTGPYMIKSYKRRAGSITLVRNPNWDAEHATTGPAYADKIVWKAGGDPNVLARQTLDSPDLLMADGPPARGRSRRRTRSKKPAAVDLAAGQLLRVAEHAAPPFNNVNLRRAVVAAADRKAYLLARGGKLVGQVATHFLGPTVAGFDEAGGADGFGLRLPQEPGRRHDRRPRST